MIKCYTNECISEVKSMDLPKTMRIFVQLIYACVRSPRTNALILVQGKASAGLFSVDGRIVGEWKNYTK